MLPVFTPSSYHSPASSLSPLPHNTHAYHRETPMKMMMITSTRKAKHPIIIPAIAEVGNPLVLAAGRRGKKGVKESREGGEGEGEEKDKREELGKKGVKERREGRVEGEGGRREREKGGIDKGKREGGMGKGGREGGGEREREERVIKQRTLIITIHPCMQLTPKSPYNSDHRRPRSLLPRPLCIINHHRRHHLELVLPSLL